MRINYKNTALALLDDPANFSFNLPKGSHNMSEYERIAFGKSVLKTFENNGDPFRKKIRYISEPFLQAFRDNRHKLSDILLNEQIEETGTLIFKGNESGFTNTVFYAIQTNGAGDSEAWDYEVIYFQFSKYVKNDHISLDVCIVDASESIKTFLYKGYADQGIKVHVFISELIALLVFLKYCDIQTKVLKSQQKDRHIGVKYLNETKNNIEILDSTWFTTLIKSDGFKVRGHFRLQPYGPGNNLRKLIWIQDFEKDGYTRAAKVLTQKPE